MRVFKVFPVAIACITASLMPFSLYAQQHAPVQLESLDGEEGEVPAITVRPEALGHQSEKLRAPGGKVTQVKVTTRGSTYYLKANDRTSHTSTSNQQSSQLRAAQWQILVFDLNRAKSPEEAVAPQQTVVLHPLSKPESARQPD